MQLGYHWICEAVIMILLCKEIQKLDFHFFKQRLICLNSLGVSSSKL